MLWRSRANILGQLITHTVVVVESPRETGTR